MAESTAFGRPCARALRERPAVVYSGRQRSPAKEPVVLQRPMTLAICPSAPTTAGRGARQGRGRRRESTAMTRAAPPCGAGRGCAAALLLVLLLAPVGASAQQDIPDPLEPMN